MPTVTIDGHPVEVPAGTNLIEAAKRAGVEIPHYCYHPSLSVVGQCRMCLVKIEGMPKLQTGCTTQVAKDGMVVAVDDPEVRAAQEGMMEFLLINHPLDCPICDQAGECGLQDYSFAHGQAFSRFRYEEKRTYPGRERIPLGPHVILNMNRCIQCTRCIRFTEEISKTGELGFFQRGARTEIGVFPDKVLDNDLSTCVVDICPVGALTSTAFRFAERVWYLDKEPSVCTGCDVGCNITIEHRRGAIKRLKPRFNARVNDHWMCDHGRGTYRQWADATRLSTPRSRRAGDEESTPASWSEVRARLLEALRVDRPAQASGFVGSGLLTTEEAYLLSRLAGASGSSRRLAVVDTGRRRSIPTRFGTVSGVDTTPNRRGCELGGLRVVASAGLPAALGLDAEGELGLLVVVDPPGELADAPEIVSRLRRAELLVVASWRESELSRAADLVLPLATAAERRGTFVSVGRWLQRIEAAFPAHGQARPAAEVLIDLLGGLDGFDGPDGGWRARTPEEVLALMASEVGALAGLDPSSIPADGVELEAGAVRGAADDGEGGA